MDDGVNAAIDPEDVGIGRLFWTIPDAIVVGDVESGRIVLWNPAAEYMFAYSAQEAVGLSLEVLIPPSLRPRHRAGLERYRAGAHGSLIETHRPAELPALRKDGHELTVELTLSPLEVPGRPKSYIIASIRDVTQRSQAQSEVRALNAELERRVEERTARLEAVAAEQSAMLQQMAEGVITVDAAGFVTFVNDAATRMMGIVKLGSRLDMLVSLFQILTLDGLPHPPEQLPLARALRGETVVNARWRMCRPGGDELVMEASAAPVRTDSGGILGAITTLRDVTEQDRLEREKNEFLSYVAHELRTPLTIIHGHVQLLQRTPRGTAATLHQRLQTIDRQSSQLALLITDLLDLALIGTHRLHCRLTPLDYPLLIQSITDEMRLLHPNRAIDLEISNNCWIMGDALRLRQLLMNLIDNALTHGPRGAAVKLSVTGNPEIVTISVRDGGPPLPAEERERIFERFHRLPPSARLHAGGLGLGLYISREIAEAHGGRLQVVDDEHSCFAFSLPIAQSRVPATHTAGDVRKHQAP